MHLIVLFDEPFWIGLVIVERAGSMQLFRRVFGAEPSDPEVAEFVRADLRELVRTAPAGIVDAPEPRFCGATHAARQRFVRDALEAPALKPAVLAALREGRAAAGAERRRDARSSRDEDEARRRSIARERAKARHRGR